MTYDQFRKICAWIHKTVDTEHFSFDDCMTVFRTFFDAYHDFTGTDHPVPGGKQIAAIMEKMPYADKGRKIPLEPEDYETLIAAYFLTPAFQDCDHRIYHFFSGDIRENRYYETIY